MLPPNPGDDPEGRWSLWTRAPGWWSCNQPSKEVVEDDRYLFQLPHIVWKYSNYWYILHCDVKTLK